jgi:hypothetical protein
MYMALYREERDMQSAVIGGRAYSPSQLTGATKQHYNKDGSISGNSSLPSFSQPYSNLAINIGISYTLNKRTNSSKTNK